MKIILEGNEMVAILTTASSERADSVKAAFCRASGIDPQRVIVRHETKRAVRRARRQARAQNTGEWFSICLPLNGVEIK